MAINMDKNLTIIILATTIRLMPDTLLNPKAGITTTLPPWLIRQWLNKWKRRCESALSFPLLLTIPVVLYSSLVENFGR